MADTSSVADGYLRGSTDTNGATDAYLHGGVEGSDTTDSYLQGLGTWATSAFLVGGIVVEDSKPAFIDVIGYDLSSKDAFLRGFTDTSDTIHVYLHGGIFYKHQVAAYLFGRCVFATSAFVRGQQHAKDNMGSAYVAGGFLWMTEIDVFLSGGDVVLDSQLAFLNGGTDTISDTDAYCEGINGHKAQTSVYLDAIERTSVHAMLEGETMANDYVWLKTDDAGATLSKKFRVIAEGYDDGTLSKSMSVEKTIGGGIDASMGEVYISWAPVIKVRHTEPISDYGDLGDLKTFYSYSDPGGTPSNRITFIDHHGTSYTIVFVGELKKQLLGAITEGEDAWSIVAVQFQEIK